LEFGLAFLTRPPKPERTNALFEPITEVKHAGPRGTQQVFMTGGDPEIDGTIAQGEREVASRLAGIDEGEGPRSNAEIDKVVNGKDGTGNVGSVAEDRQSGTGLQGFTKRISGNSAQMRSRDLDQLKVESKAELVQRPEDGVVLQGRE